MFRKYTGNYPPRRPCAVAIAYCASLLYLMLRPVQQNVLSQTNKRLKPPRLGGALDAAEGGGGGGGGGAGGGGGGADGATGFNNPTYAAEDNEDSEVPLGD